jgi:hypothetical protein
MTQQEAIVIVGSEAFRRGIPFKRNPFSVTSRFRLSWASGWAKAQKNEDLELTPEESDFLQSGGVA